MEKRGQLELSFGTIFSIILIIAFLVFAFYAIQKFLAMQDAIKTEQLMDDIQKDIDKMYASTQGNKTVEYSVSSKVISVCFNEYEEQNLVVNLKRSVESATLKHFNSAESLKAQRNICVKPVGGKIKYSLIKKYGDPLVIVKI